MSKSTPPALTSARWGARTKRIAVIILLVLTGLALYTFADVLPLLIVSALLSYLLWPLVNIIEKRVLVVLPFEARSLAVLATFIVVIASFVLGIVLIVPVLVAQIADIADAIPAFLEDLEVSLRDFLSQPLTFNGTPVLFNGEPLVPLDRIEAVVGEDALTGVFNGESFDLMGVLGVFMGSLGSLTGSAFSVLGGAINVVINISFMLVIMFYLMRDGSQFITHLVNVTPRPYQGDVRRLFYELGRVWNAYLRGQLTLCIAVGVAVYVAALVLGLPSAPLLGLVAGFLEFIPNIGPFLALVPAALIALVSESSTLPFLSGLPFALTVIVVWTAIQQLESIYLVPRVMGGSLDLHPVVVIIAVISGASLAGALGVILAAPFTATARVIGQYIYGKLFDTDPFPTPKPYLLLPPRTRLVRLYVYLRQRVRRAPESDGRRLLAQPTVSAVEFSLLPDAKEEANDG